MIHYKPLEVIIDAKYIDNLNHVNTFKYLEIFIECLWREWETKGCNYQEIEKLHQYPVVLEMNVRYLKELLLGDKIVVTAEIIPLKEKVFDAKQIMYRDNIAATEITWRFGFFDLTTRRLVPPCPKWRHAVFNTD